MQQKFEALRKALNEFVEQREALVLVIHEKVPGDLVYPLKYLEEMKRGTRRDIVMLFTHGRFEVDAYVDAMMATCEMDIDAGNELILSAREN